ncbi:MAG: tetratricopeptide repeat protein [Leptolyngbyaceae cyanobacterium bins.349]|nr:tetratricopeptide repeat protein [Leptolyngbyaceae cyanobacterium bins.349]
MKMQPVESLTMIGQPDAHQTSPEFWDGRGCTLCETAQFGAAIAAFDRAIALNPQSCKFWNHRGNALCGLQRYAEALTAYETAIALQPDYHQAWFNRGLLLAEMGAYGNAVASYDRAIALHSDPRYLHARQDIWIKENLYSAAMV